MVEILRTAEERFSNLSDYPFEPHYHEWQGMRMHYLDEGDGPPILMLHGQPNWSYLYRNFVPPLVKAGYRCIAPDYIGFGKSDKVVEDEWYMIERHIESIRSLLDALDLQDIRIVVHDWGGPIGLRQVADMPDRFSRLFILNTWLHHMDMQYTDGLRDYRAGSVKYPPGTGDISIDDGDQNLAGWLPPFPDASYKAGPRRFPWLHPYAQPVEGNAVDQNRCFEALNRWDKPAHVIFGERDDTFLPEWGRKWAGLFKDGTFDAVPSGHYPQEECPDLVVELMLRYMGK